MLICSNFFVFYLVFSIFFINFVSEINNNMTYKTEQSVCAAVRTSEDVIKAAKDSLKKTTNRITDDMVCFIMGVDWADNNPNWHDISKCDLPPDDREVLLLGKNGKRLLASCVDNTCGTIGVWQYQNCFTTFGGEIFVSDFEPAYWFDFLNIPAPKELELNN